MKWGETVGRTLGNENKSNLDADVSLQQNNAACIKNCNIFKNPKEY